MVGLLLLNVEKMINKVMLNGIANVVAVIQNYI